MCDQHNLAQGHHYYGKQMRFPASEPLTDHGSNHSAETGATFSYK